ncbi:hypothetical protein KY358_03185 [Candidatus Woesearchaeota archaeon]|nr:hypothetical protein [Candidatus Woesearchaeota archaeon]
MKYGHGRFGIKKNPLREEQKQCLSCGALIKPSYNLCWECWQVHKRNKRSTGRIPEPIEARGFMDRMGIDGWRT